MKRLLFILVLILFIASIFGVIKAYSLPLEKEETVTLLNYQHDGKFNYLIHLEPSILYGPAPQAEEEGNLVYFTKLIDNIDMNFTYKFASKAGVRATTERVKVSTILENPGKWQKEIVLVPETSQTGDFTIPIPLDITELYDLGKSFDEEIGTAGGSYDLTFKADVHMTAETNSGEITDDFVQTAKAVLTGNTLEWHRNLSLSRWGSCKGMNYQHQGRFDYAIKLKPNSIWGEISLKSPATDEPASTMTLSPGSICFTRLIDIIEVTFDYKFNADKPVRQPAEEVEVVAVLENPGSWTRHIVLVPETRKTGDFRVSFLLDLAQFDELASAIQTETGASAPEGCNLTITANVHTTAETDFEAIDDIFTHSIKQPLGGETIKWDENLAQSKSGAIEEKRIVPNQETYFAGLSVTGARSLSPIAPVVLLLTLGCLVVLGVRGRQEGPSKIEREALRLGKKYGDFIVDVEELPPVKAQETVISLTSIDDMVKLIDELHKPILHNAEEKRHTYCVFDGLTRYEYLLAEETPSTEKDTVEEVT